jgi:hypothetical protein
MRLFVAHCGYYDRSIASGIFEHHVDLLVAADDFEAAKARVKRHPDFVARSMHLDGLMAVEAVDGFRVELVADAALDGLTLTPRTPSSWRALNSTSEG